MPSLKRSLTSRTNLRLLIHFARSPAKATVNGPEEAITRSQDFRIEKIPANKENARKVKPLTILPCLLESLRLRTTKLIPSIFSRWINPDGLRSDLSYTHVTTVTSCPACTHRLENSKALVPQDPLEVEKY